MDSKSKLYEIKNNIKDFVNERNWSEFHNPKNLSMSISIEAAELMEIFQWKTIEESWEIGKCINEYAHLKEELADVLIYCLSLSNQLNIDIEKAIEDKIKKNALKYPVINDKI